MTIQVKSTLIIIATFLLGILIGFFWRSLDETSAALQCARNAPAGRFHSV